jgi:uncharacterized membrane-anchored protein
MAKVIGFVEFSGGHRYADFIPGTDKVAEYGIAALIAGGLAAKAGLFKVLLGALIALKKLIVLGLVAAAAFLRRAVRAQGSRRGGEALRGTKQKNHTCGTA